MYRFVGNSFSNLVQYTYIHFILVVITPFYCSLLSYLVLLYK